MFYVFVLLWKKLITIDQMTLGGFFMLRLQIRQEEIKNWTYFGFYGIVQPINKGKTAFITLTFTEEQSTCRSKVCEKWNYPEKGSKLILHVWHLAQDVRIKSMKNVTKTFNMQHSNFEVNSS